MQLRGVEKVVFDGVSRRQELRPLKPGDGMDHVQLHFERQAVGGAVGIHLQHPPALRLDEDMVVAVGRELDHLVFDGRTIPDPGAFDQPAIKRGIRPDSPK